MTDMKFQAGLSFISVYIKNSPFFMKRKFVLKKTRGEKCEFFDLNTQENGKFILYSV